MQWRLLFWVYLPFLNSFKRSNSAIDTKEITFDELENVAGGTSNDDEFYKRGMQYRLDILLNGALAARFYLYNMDEVESTIQNMPGMFRNATNRMIEVYSTKDGSLVSQIIG